MDLIREEKRPCSRALSWPYFVSGAAVGAALAVLLAPSSGRSTRGRIGEWLKQRRSARAKKAEAISDAVEEEVFE